MTEGLLWSHASDGLRFDAIDSALVEGLAPEATAFVASRLSDRLVLRGAAVTIDGRNVLIAGESGSGASTLAAALVLAGGSLIADGALVLTTQSDHLIVKTGPPTIALWRDTHELLGVDTDKRIAPGVEKYRWQADVFERREAIVGAIIVTERRREATSVEELAGAAAAAALARSRALPDVDPRRSMSDVVAIASSGIRIGAIGTWGRRPSATAELCARWLDVGA